MNDFLAFLGEHYIVAIIILAIVCQTLGWIAESIGTAIGKRKEKP